MSEETTQSDQQQNTMDSSLNQNMPSMTIQPPIPSVNYRPDYLTPLVQRSEILARRFSDTGNPAHLDDNIKTFIQATEIASDTYKDKAVLVHNLAFSYIRRFRLLGNIVDLNHSIDCWVEAAALTEDEDPNKLDRINNAGNFYMQRFEYLGQLSDVNCAISCFLSTISLAPDDYKFKPGLLNNAGNAYSKRFEHFQNPSDIGEAISYKNQAISLTPEGHPNRGGYLRDLGKDYILRFQHRHQPSDIHTAIEILGQAISSTPGSDINKNGQLCSLALAYQLRFEYLGNLPDIDESISCFLQATSDPLVSDQDKVQWLCGLGNSFGCRFRYLGDYADIDHGIAHQKQALAICPVDRIEIISDILSNLSGLKTCRFRRSGNLVDADESIEYLKHAISLVPDSYPPKSGMLRNLGSVYSIRFEVSKESSDLSYGISYNLQALSQTPDDHSDKHRILGDLGWLHRKRHEELNDPKDLSDAISYQSQGLLLIPEGHSERCERLAALADSYLARIRLMHNSSDAVAALELLSKAVHCSNSPPVTRFRAALVAAKVISHNFPHHEGGLERWETVMGLIRSVVWLGSTVSQQYDLVISLGDAVKEAVTAAIVTRKYEVALEWLEEGRSIVWKQFLQLRTPVDDLRAADPEIASQLEQVSIELERTSLNQQFDNALGSMAQSLDFQKAKQRHHQLAQEWENLSQTIRNIPGFDGFLLPKKVKDLASAADSGAVVAINVNKNTCGALVLKSGSMGVTYIPLPTFSEQKASHAHKQLKHLLHHHAVRQLPTRKFVRSQEAEVNLSFHSVLNLLWTDVVKPVLDGLGYTNSPVSGDLPHVTWCATGPLSFLPLHAAGCYDAKLPGSRVFDYVVSSYTPSLSALLRPAGVSREFTGILAVGQSETPGQASLPGTAEELEIIAKRLGKLRTTRLEGNQAIAETVITGMAAHSWVHFACHASQNSSAPGASAFYLNDGPLRLSTIMGHNLKNADFAFLSACQTASGDENLPDEAVHLAAGMLMAGYRSVIATTWSIRDIDAPLVAERVYAHMLTGDKPDSRKASRALHLAVKELREKIGENHFASWVPYIHIGV